MNDLIALAKSCQLLSMYQHKVFVQWNVNSFDQWGVELAKELAGRIQHNLLHDLDMEDHDPSTNGLLKHYIKIAEQKETDSAFYLLLSCY